MSMPWRDYLSSADAETKYRNRLKRTRRNFAEQRDVMTRAVAALKPRTVACLGAGALNDIPYPFLVRSGADIHLVDWVPGSVEAGLCQSIITRGDDGDPACTYCSLESSDARAYCRHYAAPDSPRQGVCRNFKPGDGDPPTCAAYALGERPAVHYEDATAGYAAGFGAGVDAALDGVTSWRQAFAGANALAKRVRRHRTSLSIADHGIDLVTSSMLVSQFEHQPYDYFANRAAQRLGAPDRREEDRLRPAMERLRSTLLRDQIERHCEEIRRLLAPGGHCLMSFEMFHFDATTSRWFVVRQMLEALDLLSRYFDFDMDGLDPASLVTRYRNGDSASLVHTYLLTPAQ